jgi:hypothetical protein
MKNNIFIVIVILLLVAFVIIKGWEQKEIIDSSTQCLNKNDIRKIEGIVYGGCYDWWHVSHFILWLIIGMILPHQYILALITGISWDYLEHYFFKYKLEWCDRPFCGRHEDIFFNMSGYIIGSQLNLLNKFPILTKG